MLEGAEPLHVMMPIKSQPRSEMQDCLRVWWVQLSHSGEDGPETYRAHAAEQAHGQNNQQGQQDHGAAA